MSEDGGEDFEKIITLNSMDFLNNFLDFDFRENKFFLIILLLVAFAVIFLVWQFKIMYIDRKRADLLARITDINNCPDINLPISYKKIYVFLTYEIKGKFRYIKDMVKINISGSSNYAVEFEVHNGRNTFGGGGRGIKLMATTLWTKGMQREVLKDVMQGNYNIFVDKGKKEVVINSIEIRGEK